MKQGQNISQLYSCRSQQLIVCEGITSCVNAITGKKYPIVHATYHNFEMHFQGLLHRYCGHYYVVFGDIPYGLQPMTNTSQILLSLSQLSLRGLHQVRLNGLVSRVNVLFTLSTSLIFAYPHFFLVS